MSLRSIMRAFVLGASAGAAAVYFNDPERGAQRREEFAEKASMTMNNMSKVADDAKEIAGQATEQAREKAQEVKQKGQQMAEDANDESHTSGDRMTTDSTVDLTGSGTDAATPGEPDPLYVPGQRPI